MKLRIKEICREKGLLMRDIAERLNLTEVGLSKSLNGNPTIQRLEDVAKALEVDFLELFTSKNEDDTPIFIKNKNGEFEIIGYLKK